MLLILTRFVGLVFSVGPGNSESFGLWLVRATGRGMVIVAADKLDTPVQAARLGDDRLGIRARLPPHPRRVATPQCRGNQRRGLVRPAAIDAWIGQGGADLTRSFQVIWQRFRGLGSGSG